MMLRPPSYRFAVYYSVIILCFSIISPRAITSEKNLCTHGNLLITEYDAVQLMTNMLSPLSPNTFLTRSFERQPAAIVNRPSGYYSGLVDLNVITDYLISKQSSDVSKKESSSNGERSRSGISNFEHSKIQHGGDWKLVKRVWRDGEWWSSTPNISMIPLPVIFASFQKYGYSIVIDKLQDFHPPIKKVTTILKSIFGCRVNANLYLTPYGDHQAFETHFDWMDGFVLQVMGCKEWKVYPSQASINPLPDTVYKIKDKTDGYGNGKDNNDKRNCDDNDDDSDSNESNVLEFTGYNLGPGSLLYIPRGHAHEAATNCTPAHKEADGSKRRKIEIDGDDVDPEASSEASASIHMTFGLESATDSTLEIFLHHSVDIHFKTSNTSSLAGHSCINGGKITIIFENESGTSTIQIVDISIRDYFHIIIHNAATIKGNIDIAANSKSKQMDAVKKVGEKAINNIYINKLLGSAILRQSVAVTNYTANNLYQPMLYNVLPDGLDYLRSYFSYYSISDIFTKAVILGVNMGHISPSFSGDVNNDILNDTDNMNIKNKGKNEIKNKIKLSNNHNKNLNYIKQFMSSSPKIHITGKDVQNVRTTQNIDNNNENIRNYREFVLEYLQRISSESLDLKVISNGSKTDLISLFLDFITTLEGPTGTSETAEELKSIEVEMDMELPGTLNNQEMRKLNRAELETSNNLYCDAWKSLTHKLKSEREKL